MEIGEVERLSLCLRIADDDNKGKWNPASNIARVALSALRAEAWHPIEKAAELGAKDGRELLVRSKGGHIYLASWDGEIWVTDSHKHFADDNLTHFRFINPPEGA